jgi:hypothetical protein
MAKRNQWTFIINKLEKLWGFPFLLIFQKKTPNIVITKNKGLTKNSFFSSEKIVETKRKNTFD